MNRYIPFALWIALLPSLASGQVEKNYNKFDDRTTVSTKTWPLTSITKGHGSHEFSALASCKGQFIEGKAFDDVSILVSCISDDWIYLEHQRDLQMQVLADERRISGKIDYFKSEILDGPRCYEAMAFRFSPEDFKTIVSSKRVEVQIWNTQFDFESFDLKRLRELAAAAGIADPLPELVPFEDTDNYQKLSTEVKTSEAEFTKAQSGEYAAMQASPEYAALTKAISEADANRKRLTGQARLDASKVWVEANAKLEKLKADFGENDPVVIRAKKNLDEAKLALLKARAEYQDNPTTRPGARPL